MPGGRLKDAGYASYPLEARRRNFEPFSGDMPDTLKSDKHVNVTAIDSISGTESTGIGYVVHVAKRKAEEPCG